MGVLTPWILNRRSRFPRMRKRKTKTMALQKPGMVTNSSFFVVHCCCRKVLLNIVTTLIHMRELKPRDGVEVNDILYPITNAVCFTNLLSTLLCFMFLRTLWRQSLL